MVLPQPRHNNRRPDGHSRYCCLLVIRLLVLYNNNLKVTKKNQDFQSNWRIKPIKTRIETNQTIKNQALPKTLLALLQLHKTQIKTLKHSQLDSVYISGGFFFKDLVSSAVVFAVMVTGVTFRVIERALFSIFTLMRQTLTLPVAASNLHYKSTWKLREKMPCKRDSQNTFHLPSY